MIPYPVLSNWVRLTRFIDFEGVPGNLFPGELFCLIQSPALGHEGLDLLHGTRVEFFSSRKWDHSDSVIAYVEVFNQSIQFLKPRIEDVVEKGIRLYWLW